jgi:hypothetical protein
MVNDFANVGKLNLYNIALHRENITYITLQIKFIKIAYLCDMKGNKEIKKGLSDTELIDKYERGKIDLKRPIKRLLKTQTNSSVLRKGSSKVKS